MDSALDFIGNLCGICAETLVNHWYRYLYIPAALQIYLLQVRTESGEVVKGLVPQTEATLHISILSKNRTLQILYPYVTRNPDKFTLLMKQKPCTFMSPFRSGVGRYSTVVKREGGRAVREGGGQ
jgi:hypothetical protein